MGMGGTNRKGLFWSERPSGAGVFGREARACSVIAVPRKKALQAGTRPRQRPREGCW